MNKKATILTYLSFKKYILLWIIVIVLILSYIYLFPKIKQYSDELKKGDCPKEIIPERIKCIINEGKNCVFNIRETYYWKDGTKFEYSLYFRQGFNAKENINYMYPSMDGGWYLPRYERQDINAGGIIGEKIIYGVYLVLDSRDETEEGYRVVESSCERLIVKD